MLFRPLLPLPQYLFPPFVIKQQHQPQSILHKKSCETEQKQPKKNQSIDTLKNHIFLINQGQNKVKFYETDDNLFITLSNINNNDETIVSIDYKLKPNKL